MSDELALLDATAQAGRGRQRRVSPRELVDGAIGRIERVNPQLNAVLIQRFEKARAEAAAPELPDGPFRGVPFLLKDLICHSAGDPYHAGMRLLRELKWVERYDTYLAARFRAAGFVFLGRTNVPELGPAPTTEPVAYGPTRNPWDTSRSPGGSSGGSAAAGAAGLVPVAHANDGGGSIRIPSSECGLVGLEPSPGRTSLGPAAGVGRAAVAVITAATVCDLTYWSERTGRKIGPGDVEPMTWAIAEMGRRVSASDYLRAIEYLRAHTRQVAAWWAEGFDLLLTPTLPEPPPRLGEFDPAPDDALRGFTRGGAFVAFTMPFNVTGQPAISLPLHWTTDGLPIGVQLGAAYGREDLLLRIAAQLEEARPWSARRPPVHA